jgi:predicted nucleotidyltransferase
MPVPPGAGNQREREKNHHKFSHTRFDLNVTRKPAVTPQFVRRPFLVVPASAIASCTEPTARLAELLTFSVAVVRIAPRNSMGRVIAMSLTEWRQSRIRMDQMKAIEARDCIQSFTTRTF